MCVRQEILALYNTEVFFDEPISKHTHYKLGGKAKYFACPKTVKDLYELLFIANTEGVKYFILGNGSNVLASDNGFDGIIICTKYLDFINIENDKARCFSGVKLSTFLTTLKDNCLSGLEYLAGIPATIGGATFMNAGAHGGCISDRVVSVQTICDGKLKKYYSNECDFSYRNSSFQRNNEVILSVDFLLEKSDYEICKSKLEHFYKLRKYLPKKNNCGCIFKNPIGTYAGKLIEQAGLKGATIGGASVSSEHANFIETSDGATSIDVYKLINYVKDVVYKEYNVKLIEEVKFLGDFNDSNG